MGKIFLQNIGREEILLKKYLIFNKNLFDKEQLIVLSGRLYDVIAESTSKYWIKGEDGEEVAFIKDDKNTYREIKIND